MYKYTSISSSLMDTLSLPLNSEELKFVTAHPFKSRSTDQIKTVLEMVLDKYDACGFNVTIVRGDNELNIE